MSFAAIHQYLTQAHSFSLVMVAVVSFFTGFLPTIGIEVYLAYTAIKVKLFVMLIVIALVAATGQMFSKVIIYGMGAGGIRFLPKRHRNKLDSWQQKFNQSVGKQRLLIICSALTGLPPFYAINIICGTLRSSFHNFFWLGLVGTFVRFSVIAFIPAWVLHYYLH